MARKRGNVITLSGIGRSIGRMSGGAKMALGAVILGVAGIGGIALYKKYKARQQVGYMTPADAWQGIDYNTRFTQQYYARQRELLNQRQRAQFS